jgi:hypothetical protein
MVGPRIGLLGIQARRAVNAHQGALHGHGGGQCCMRPPAAVDARQGETRDARESNGGFDRIKSPA